MTGARHAADDARPGDGLVRAGAIVFGVGVLGAIAAFVLFVTGSADVPLWVTLLAVLMPVGLGLALLGLLRGAQARRRDGVRRRSSTPNERPGS